MYDIKIARFTEDPTAQGVIRAEDGAWQLVIDKDGFPHLWVRVQTGPGPDGVGGDAEAGTGLLCIEDMMPPDCKIRDLMTGVFGGELTPEEEAEAHADYLKERESSGIPCPR